MGRFGYGHGAGLARHRRMTGGAVPLAGWTCALDFRNDAYKSEAGLLVPLAAMPGYGSVRAGAKKEQSARTGAVLDFATDAPAIVPGYGFMQRYAATNLLLNAGASANLATQAVTLVSGRSYTLSFVGSGSITVTGAASAALANPGAIRGSITFTAAASGAATFTVAGTVSYAMLNDNAVTRGPIVATTGTPATVATDDLHFAAPTLPGDWLIVCAVISEDLSTAISGQMLWGLSDGTASNYYEMQRNTNGTARFRYRASGSNNDLSLSSAESGAVGLVYGVRKIGTGFTLARQGPAQGYATSTGTLGGTLPSGINLLDVGKRLTNCGPGAHAFWGLRPPLNDTDLQALIGQMATDYL